MNRAMVVEAQSQRDRSATQRPMLRWHAKAGLLVASIALLSFSFAPFDQWYLTWIGLVPMLIVIADCRSAWSAYCWTWIAATVFFAANMWWLIYVTGPGMAALVVLLGMYWAVPAMMLRASGVLYPRLAGWPDRRSDAREANTQAHPAKRPLPMTARMLLIPTAWVGLEWLRGTWPLHGLPWLYLGHTQSPALLICQIADLMGVAGVTFLVVLFNAFVALAILDGGIRRLRVAGGIVAACILATMIYGAIRFSQEAGDTTPGPRVLVVQANVPQSNSGSKGASQEDLIRFHVKETDDALARDPHQDLVVWSETMAPQINRQMLDFVHQRFNPSSLDEMFEAIAEVAANHQTNLLTGGLRWTDLAWNGDYPVARDRRNVAYLFNSDGQLTQRYDKVHLVPFGEYMPFQDSLPILYRLLMTLNPYGQDSQYTLTPGSMDALTVFRIQGAEDKTWRFVTPICFEDIDGPMVQKMFKPDRGSANKRADFIVNITNDGWFKGGENAQHLQASIFRAIENRAPIARSVNTGISGFVDSMGRPGELVPARTEGTAWAQLRLDSRTTLYSRYGDWFAFVCAGLTGILAIVSLLATRVGRWATGLVFRGRVIRNAS